MVVGRGAGICRAVGGCEEAWACEGAGMGAAMAAAAAKVALSLRQRQQWPEEATPAEGVAVVFACVVGLGVFCMSTVYKSQRRWFLRYLPVSA